MQKIAINRCFGGFSLSYAGVMEYARIKGIDLYPYIDDITRNVYGDRAVIGNEEILHHYSTVPVDNSDDLNKYYWSDRDIERNDPALIKLISKWKKKSAGRCAELKIIEIPDEVEYTIEEYDGLEHVAEKHRTWE